jgi:hypothetical protein
MSLDAFLVHDACSANGIAKGIVLFLQAALASSYSIYTCCVLVGGLLQTTQAATKQSTMFFH